MRRTAEHAGAALVGGFALAVLAAVLPAGLDGRAVPPLSWAAWALAVAAALAGFAGAGVPPLAALKRLAWLVPLVALLAVPAAFVAPTGSRAAVAAALAARAFASASLAAMLATRLGPAGIVAGLRALRVPARLVDVAADALAGLSVVSRQVLAMLRAREARRPSRGAWSRLAASPRRTTRGFGRLVAALLLRSLERAEAVERARRARGAER